MFIDKFNKFLEKHYIALLIIAAIIGFLFTLTGVFVDEAEAINALETQGYSDITINDKEILFIGYKGCDSKDAALFDVTANNPVGNRVDVIVCVGWPFKGATIRTK